MFGTSIGAAAQLQARPSDCSKRDTPPADRADCFVFSPPSTVGERYRHWIEPDAWGNEK
jgi:hypothetical protein